MTVTIGESTPLVRGLSALETPIHELDTDLAKHALVPSSSSPSRQTIPLAASRLIPALRRGVSFSPKPETKLFNINDSILPENGPPPASIRSYANEPSSSASPPPHTRVGTPPFVSETPTLVRSVLKRRKIQDIRIAKSVEEGTLNNREDARLLVTGRRPGLVARDSYQLAMMRKGTDEISLKSSKLVEMPGSDDSAASDDRTDEAKQAGQASESDEEEEEVEQDGALTTGSLVDIVLNGAEDLLTLEEAYKTLSARLKKQIPLGPDDVTNASSAEIEVCLRPIRDEAPAMVRAFYRDVQRLLGKVPNSEVAEPERSSSPFRGLVPLRDSTPVNRAQTPSPTPVPSSDIKAPKAPRQGYSEAEVRYRREASGVGQAALGLLALVFHCRPIFTCFSEADLQSLLDLVLTIPRIPQLPTPNPKRTYFVATSVISNMQLPVACVNPIREKIARAIESMTSDTFGPAGAPIRDPNFKKEVYAAIGNLINTYPFIFFGYTTELLAPCLRSLTSPTVVIRNRATAAVVAFAGAKFSIQTEARERAAREKTSAAKADWVRIRQTIQKSEVFVSNHLKRVKATPGRVVYTPEGEKKTEWFALDKLIKDKMMNDVHGGCAIWAAMVSLLGTHFATCGLTEGPQGFNNIMNKSLQVSSNTTRAILARVAWNHAIHAYLSAGSAQSIGDDFQLVQSYKPFASFGLQDATERLQTIQMPVDLAMELALAPGSYTKVVNTSTRFNGEQRCHWDRKEKGKKLQWTVTCGESAAAVVYAFVGSALLHEEQPAKEMSAMSGLPSSDGAPIPESARFESRLERLDKAWDKVVEPLLRSLFSLHGVDKLKLHGWAIFSALVSHKTDTDVSAWNLDRLLCDRYLSGEALMDKLKDKEVGGTFLDALEAEAVGTKDIPSMGSAWIVRRLESVLDMFQEAIGGIHGINDLYGGEAVNLGQGFQFPLILSRVWSSILHAVSTLRETDPAAHVAGVRSINRHIFQVFNGNPATYLPVSLMSDMETWSVDLNLARILIANRLFDMAHSMLGTDAVTQTILPPDIDSVDAAMSKMAFGTEHATGRYSMTGSLLAMIMGTKEFSDGLAQPARETLKTIIAKMLDIGCVHGNHAKFLGDMTNRLHAVYEDQEDIQLDIWRVLASKWATIVDTGIQSSGGTNHTGVLLVSLLSSPFRGRQLHSIWHQHAGQEDLVIWSNLLEVVVARFRAKRVGSNLGVLESLAGHLGDFLRDAEKASSSTITLSCLAAAASHISCTELSHHVDDHFSINENYVPLDFLALVSDALDESYPRTDTLEEVSREDAVSPAVYTLLNTLRAKFDTLPTEFAMHAFEAVRVGLLTWLADVNKVVMPDQAAQVDMLYVSLMRLFGNAIEKGVISASASTFDGFVEVVAPRLSRAASRAVPEAFQSLYKHFEHVDASDYSEDTSVFLRSVVTAVPDFVSVKGLAVQESLSEEESLAQFPHARELGSQSFSSPLEALVPPTPEQSEDVEMADSQLESLVPAVDISTEYDADMSASVGDTQSLAQAASEVRPREDTAGTESSPASSAAASSQNEVIQVDDSVVDVFGPAKSAPKRKGRKSQRVTPSRKKSRTPRSRSSTVEVDVKPILMPEVAEADEEEPGDCIVAEPSPERPTSEARVVSYDLKPAPLRHGPGKSGFITSASRWMSRLPALGGLFSPSRHDVDFAGEGEFQVGQDDAATPVETGRKRKAAPQFGRSYSQPEMGTSAPASATTRSIRRKTTVNRVEPTVTRSSRSSKRTKMGSTQSEPVIVVVESDGEDELLLSPESAKQRKAEEKRALRESSVLQSQYSTGRFDDAPELSARLFPGNGNDTGNAAASPSSPRPQVPATGTTMPDASPARTVNHARLLQMVQEAERQKTLVESMNYDDLEKFMDMIGTLQGAGQASMKMRMEELRKGKKRGGKK